MGKEVTLSVDGITVTVPAGTLVVDAAKKAGIDIPVFCYHPKLSVVGMCRMCLVEIGRPMFDRATREPVLNPDGTQKIGFGPKLETSCTTPVSEGMVVVTNNEKVEEARKDILEFLLTSHPLDCPICDKGGECPLQNLAMAYGPSESRFKYDDKKHLGKHVPLGELIYLDRERCIQCSRCVRFQTEVVDDPVIGFYNRGRSLEIMTNSEPGFDSIFSGNTTDICPVGALTTADFRFNARPWEMKSVPSICNHCAVGCNLTMNVRREARASGRTVVKRVMPRQNEAVNEIWICDKGRFAYHYTESDERLVKPLIRKNGELVETTWEEALDLTAEKLKAAGKDLLTLVGGRMANEDLFNLRRMTDSLGGKSRLYSEMGGGDLVARVGVAPGTNLGALDEDSVIMVVASDLHEEAPLWWLRVKQAVERGAKLIVINPRQTRLDAYADYTFHYRYGEEQQLLRAFIPSQPVDTLENLQFAVGTFAGARNAIIMYGSEGLGLEASSQLAQTCAEILAKTNHVGEPNNGLIAVWPHGNTQGAWDMGYRPAANLTDELSKAAVAYVAAADPLDDDLAYDKAFEEAGFVVVADLFLTKTAQKADVVLPVSAFTEREGTYTSGERRVQRFYTVVTPLPGPRADFAIAAQLAQRMDIELEGRNPALIMTEIAQAVAGYGTVSYGSLSEAVEQWPVVGREDLYYGGTAYDNKAGLGITLVPAVDDFVSQDLPEPVRLPDVPQGAVLAVPVTRLYDQGTTVLPSDLLHERLAAVHLQMHPATAEKLGLKADMMVQVDINGVIADAEIAVDDTLPEGVALIPRSVGLSVTAPTAVKIQQAVVES